MQGSDHGCNIIGGKNAISVFFRQLQLFADSLLHQMIQRNRFAHVNQRHEIADAKTVFII